jgi:orsellinic acid C2-O-methyltransferase
MELPGDRSLYGAMIGGGEGARLGLLLEGHITCQVAGVIARLGVPDHLGGKAQTAGDLAAAVGAEPDALARVLAAAAVYGLVTKDRVRVGLPGRPRQ